MSKMKILDWPRGRIKYVCALLFVASILLVVIVNESLVNRHYRIYKFPVLNGSRPVTISVSKGNTAMKFHQNSTTRRMSAHLATSVLKRVQGFDYNVFLFSAVVGNSSSNASWDRIVLQGWENATLVNYTFGCCIRYASGALESVKMLQKIHWAYKDMTKMPVKQYVCPNVRNISDKPVAVTIFGSSSSTTCHNKYNWYLAPKFAYRHDQEIAVCSKLNWVLRRTNARKIIWHQHEYRATFILHLKRDKTRRIGQELSYLHNYIVAANSAVDTPFTMLAFGNLAADDVLTWFEIQRLMGVDKVLTYTYKLNPEATKVLDYYQSIGMAEVIPFSLPKPVKGRRQVEVGVKNMQAWNDEQIPVFDCLERLQGYTYLALFDLDEYLVPAGGKSWKELFKSLFKRQPNAAGFTFRVQLHITTWGITNNSSQFKIGRYLNSTRAMADRMKHVVMPDRITQGGISTHNFRPQSHSPYKRYQARAVEDGVIHHFRSCRKDWGKRNTTKCVDLERHRDTTLSDIMSRIEDGVNRLKTDILNRK